MLTSCFVSKYEITGDFYLLFDFFLFYRFSKISMYYLGSFKGSFKTMWIDCIATVLQ